MGRPGPGLSSWRRPIGRADYLSWGLVLFGLKFLTDLAIAQGYFGRTWSPLHYLVPSETLEILLLPPEERSFLGTMVCAAIPFMLVGLYLTQRRLIAANLPGWMILFFFIPVVNLLFFLVLCVMPSRDPAGEVRIVEGIGVSEDPGTWPSPTGARRGPATQANPATLAILLPAPIALAFTWLSTNVLQNYGWGLFLGIPFCVGMSSAMLLGRSRPARLGRCLAVGQAALLAYGAMLLIVAIEGIICLVMAWPIAAVVTLIGSILGWGLVLAPPDDDGAPPFKALLVVIAALPALLGAEAATRAVPILFAVRTSVEIDATPQRVWQHVISFPDLPPPTDWLLRSGIAYPTHAEIDGRGAGAVRRCVFSTGTFIEPIEVWDEPRLLKFFVTSNPPAMREWSPWANINPPHVEDFLVSRGGQFRLVALPGGRTRLEGTTWYHHNMSPAGYWRIFSDAIIHRIHRRVLDHVKALAEAK